jgi:hypothetical protein
MNTALRVLLALWIVIFLAISCAPLIADNAIVGGLGFLTGAVLLVPWLIGVVVLALLIWATSPRRGAR